MEAAFRIALDAPLGPPSLSTTKLATFVNIDTFHSVVAAEKRLIYCALRPPNGPLPDVQINAMNGLPFPQKLGPESYSFEEVSDPFSATVESVSSHDRLVCAVDSRGMAKCYEITFDNKVTGGDEKEPARKKAKREASALALKGMYATERSRTWEEGWAGTAISQGKDCLAVTHSFGRESVLFDIESSKQTRTLSHMLQPTACAFIKGGPISPLHDCYVVSEWNALTAWDLRAPPNEKACATFRALGTLNSKALYSFDVAADGLTIVCGGVSKEVLFVDARKWTVASKWRCPVKHDIVGVQVNETETGTEVFVAGLDHELVKHARKDAGKPAVVNMRRTPVSVPQSVPVGSLLHQNHRVFRSEAQWAGLQVVNGPGDRASIALGLDAAKNLYYLKYTS